MSKNFEDKELTTEEEKEFLEWIKEQEEYFAEQEEERLKNEPPFDPQ